MKKLLTAATFLVFLGPPVLSIAFSPLPNTGDAQLDSLLGKINERTKADPDAFIKQLSQTQGISQQEIRQAREMHELSDADTYMAAALAHKTNRRMEDVAAEYKQNQGKGWGVMAVNMGIKPGSPEFKELKVNARGSLDHRKTTAKAKKRQQEQEMEQEREHSQKIKAEARGKSQGKGNKK